VTPLAELGGLENMFEEAVFLLGPGTSFCHLLLAYNIPNTIIAHQPTVNLESPP
jgi:hypothetical protein